MTTPGRLGSLVTFTTWLKDWARSDVGPSAIAKRSSAYLARSWSVPLAARLEAAAT
jgi:hypothetical protein